MTAFSGVDGTHPFDTADSTVVDTTYTAAKLTVPGVTTVTNGASLIGGVGLDNKAVTVAAPSGWTEAWQSSGAEVAELARGSGSTAGPTGDVTWTLNGPAAGAAWIVPLRPAADPQAPVASFASSVASGTAPLVVQFTDTSTNGPTTWAWDVGDGSTASSKSPSHTYTRAGTYSVKLTVANAAGSSSSGSSVDVRAQSQGRLGILAQMLQRLLSQLSALSGTVR